MTELHPIVLGTAGHIDHGKTSLVKALTGIDTDRLKVEKERGITTELGFAHLDLGGRQFGLVDVPGHERFIRAMVSGAGGLDLVCLVIAADEGIMPQTREHLDVCELLGVRRGVIVLSKVDLVDAEWQELVSQEIREGLAGSFLAEAKLIGISAKTGEGIEELKTELLRLTCELSARPSDGLFRLPLDRVFSIKGFGTVVTGTVLSGQVKVGDAVVTHPNGATAKVRGIEVHGEEAVLARAGLRCALNLSGVATDDVSRGDLLAHPNALAPSHLIDARFRYLSTSKASLPRRSRILLHHGTTQLLASLILVDTDRLEPGAEALVQLRIDMGTPLAALPGDRFIARGFTVQKHYGTTLGGGEIIRVNAPKVRRSSEQASAAVKALAAAAGDERVMLEIRAANVAGLSRVDLIKRLGTSEAETTACLTRLTETGAVVSAGESNPALIDAAVFATLEKKVADAIIAFEKERPESGGIGKQELRGRLPIATPPRIFDEILDGLVRRKAATLDQDRVRIGEARRFGSEPMSPLEAKLEIAFRAWANTPPKVKHIANELGIDVKTSKAALAKLLAKGVLIKVNRELYAHADAISALEKSLRRHLDDNGQITPGEWKAITGTSRKWAIPFAEYFDHKRLTIRVGDVRKRRG